MYMFRNPSVVDFAWSSLKNIQLNAEATRRPGTDTVRLVEPEIRPQSCDFSRGISVSRFERRERNPLSG